MPRFVRATTFLFMAVLTLAACGGSAAPGRSAPRTDPNVITQEQLEPLVGLNAKQAIERLRPAYLRVRGTTSINNPAADMVQVYLDNSHLGGTEQLEGFQVSELKEIRYLDAAAATNRFGNGHAHGAIILVRKIGL